MEHPCTQTRRSPDPRLTSPRPTTHLPALHHQNFYHKRHGRPTLHVPTRRRAPTATLASQANRAPHVEGLSPKGQPSAHALRLTRRQSPDAPARAWAGGRLGVRIALLGSWPPSVRSTSFSWMLWTHQESIGAPGGTQNKCRPYVDRRYRCNAASACDVFQWHAHLGASHVSKEIGQLVPAMA